MALKIKFNSPVILTFATICCAVFYVNKAMLNQLMPMFTLYNETNFANPLAIFRLVSHIVGHGSIEHLLGNLTFVLLLGPIVEERYGSRATVIMILVTAVLTSVCNILFFNQGLMGASGIVFMLIVLVSFTNVRNGEIPITFILVAILFIGKELLNSIWQDQVSQFAHIMGGVCGAFFGFRGNSAPR
jgi:membrane associated rhomboid family serine protease